MFSDARFSTVSTTAKDSPFKLVFLADGPRIFCTEEEWWLETMAPLSGIIDTSERGNATTWLSFEKIFYQGDFPGCCVIGGGIS